MWNLIVSVPDHCLSFYFTYHYIQDSFDSATVFYVLLTI